ncbi:hypothetical protein BBJ28_00024495 [Nothophytophthora sp. Chile5]|nr:hypothetical protein BBJ28_00024495 [Nothophytophthora sp. Chile5]
MAAVTRFLGASLAADDADNAQYKWIGLGIVIGSAVLSNLGVNVQKLSHVREERPAFERRTYYTRPVWLVGMVLIVLGAIGDFEALGFAPQALVASVGGGFTVLANVFFAHLWLGQVLTRTDVLGTLLIIIGVVLSTVANEPDDQMSLLELEKQFFQLGFLVYLGVMVCALSSIAKAHYQLWESLNATAKLQLRICASILMILTVSGENQFVYFTTYLFMGGMVCTLVLQTDLLNRAIMVGDTLSVFPMFQCFWIGSSVIGGVVFYEKYVHFSVFDWVCLPIALASDNAAAVIIVGIYLLAKHGEDDEDDTEDTPGHRAHLTSGHFGALMPLSPQGHSYSHSGFRHKSFDDHEEHLPLRPAPANGHTNGHTNGHNGDLEQQHPYRGCCFRSLAFKVQVGAVEAPRDPIADRQRLQQTWTISGGESLEKLRVALPGLTYVSVAPSSFFDQVAASQGQKGQKSSERLVAVARVSSDTRELLERVDVLARRSNRLLLGFDPRPPRGWPMEPSTEPGRHLLTEIFVREASELRSLSVFGGGDLVVASSQEEGGVLIADRPYDTLKLAAMRGSRLFVAEPERGLRVGDLALLAAGEGQLYLSTAELSARQRIRVATSGRWEGSDVLVQTSQLVTPKLRVAVAGPGAVRFASLSEDGESLCDHQMLAIAGSGVIDTGDLRSRTARVGLLGSGSVTLRTSDSVSVGSLGSAKVYYLDPEPATVWGRSTTLRPVAETVRAQRRQEQAAAVVPPTRESAFDDSSDGLRRWWWGWGRRTQRYKQ